MAPAKRMGDGSQKVLRDWRYSDPQSGAVTCWKKDQPYTGSLDIPWLFDPKGPDGWGPLISSGPASNTEKVAEKATEKPAEKSSLILSDSDSSNKEK